MSRKNNQDSGNDQMRLILQLLGSMAAASKTDETDKKKKKTKRTNTNSGFTKPYMTARAVEEFIDNVLYLCDDLDLPNTVRHTDGRVWTTMMDMKQCIKYYVHARGLAEESKDYLIVDDWLEYAVGRNNLKSLGKNIYEERTGYDGELIRYIWRGKGSSRNYIATLESLMRKRRD